MSLPERPAVAASPEQGYRLRAHLHVKDTRVGFFREGSHAICDAGPTGQLRADTLAGVAWVSRALGPRLAACDSMIVAENVVATERVVHLVARDDVPLDDLRLTPASHLTGITTSASGRASSWTDPRRCPIPPRRCSAPIHLSTDPSSGSVTRRRFFKAIDFSSAGC